MLVKCWKVAPWNGKKLQGLNLKNLQPTFFDVFYVNVNQKLFLSFFTIIASIGQEKFGAFVFMLLANMGENVIYSSLTEQNTRFI